MDFGDIEDKAIEGIVAIVEIVAVVVISCFMYS